MHSTTLWTKDTNRLDLFVSNVEEHRAQLLDKSKEGPSIYNHFASQEPLADDLATSSLPSNSQRTTLVESSGGTNLSTHATSLPLDDQRGVPLKRTLSNEADIDSDSDRPDSPTSDPDLCSQNGSDLVRQVGAHLQRWKDREEDTNVDDDVWEEGEEGEEIHSLLPADQDEGEIISQYINVRSGRFNFRDCIQVC